MTTEMIIEDDTKDNIKRLLAEFRIWERQWNDYSNNKTKLTPASIDEFSEKLSEKFIVTKLD